MIQLRFWRLLVGSLAISLTASARADLLYFRSGGAIETPVSIEGESIVLEIPGARTAFLPSDFRKRIPGPTPMSLWEQHWRKAQGGPAAAGFEAIWWAIQHGLTFEVLDAIRELHRLAPNHPATTRMAATLRHLERPCADPEIAAFRKTLEFDAREARGPHVLLLHAQTDSEAEARIELLERVVLGFYLTASGEGLDLTVPRRRLVFAWFNDHRDYLRFLHTQQASAFATTRGYFHPTWNAVVAYDCRSTETHQTALASCRNRREELRRFRDRLRQIPPGARLRVGLTGETPRTMNRAQAEALADRVERDILREELLLELDRRAIDDGTAAHEMVHLLAANSGLIPRPDAFPVWLQEGLATQFEVIRGGRWAGIGQTHDLRLPDWRKITPAPRLDPLIRDAGFGRGYQREPYAQAWALVYYLRSRQPAGFLKFLDLLRSPEDLHENPRNPAERWVAAFHRAFGTDTASLEHDWHQFMATQKTPLERHASDEEPTP